MVCPHDRRSSHLLPGLHWLRGMDRDMAIDRIWGLGESQRRMPDAFCRARPGRRTRARRGPRVVRPIGSDPGCGSRRRRSRRDPDRLGGHHATQADTVGDSVIQTQVGRRGVSGLGAWGNSKRYLANRSASLRVCSVSAETTTRPSLMMTARGQSSSARCISWVMRI